MDGYPENFIKILESVLEQGSINLENFYTLYFPECLNDPTFSSDHRFFVNKDFSFIMETEEREFVALQNKYEEEKKIFRNRKTVMYLLNQLSLQAFDNTNKAKQVAASATNLVSQEELVPDVNQPQNAEDQVGDSQNDSGIHDEEKLPELTDDGEPSSQLM